MRALIVPLFLLFTATKGYTGTEYSYYKRVKSSAPINPNLLTKNLRSGLLQVGDLFTKVNRNTIGCCAEVNAANELLIARPFLLLNEFYFSKAIRPRTMQFVPTCKNCKQTFR